MSVRRLLVPLEGSDMVLLKHGDIGRSQNRLQQIDIEFVGPFKLRDGFLE